MKKSATSQSQPTSNPPVSERKATANRANAQHSTGPRTPQGKAASSLNALRHGILARAAFNVTIEGEERRTEFEDLIKGLAQEFQPRTMTEHMTVQQLAGCYWRLAKVWTFEIEAAWRSNNGTPLTLEEYERYRNIGLLRNVDDMIEEQEKLFPRAGLGKPTIPTPPTAVTILRYQSTINSMLFRCLLILERRLKERLASDEAHEEVDYMNEPTAASEAEPQTVEKAPEESAEPSKNIAIDAGAHKRTQKDATDAPLSPSEEVVSASPATIEDAIASEKSPGKPRTSL